MADITLANSTYSTGTNDTASTLVNNVTATDAQQYNGAASAIIGIETTLGTATDLKGSTADLVARLAVEHNADGTQKNVTVAKGGTGATSFTDGAVLLGNGTSAIQALALPSGQRYLFHDGTAGADPSWQNVMMYQGPTSCGASSTRSHSGSVTISADGNYSGVYYYTNLTLNSGVTMTIPAGAGRLVIFASGTVTINGTISGVGGGLSAGGLADTAGGPGTDQPGGAGGSYASAAGGAGGSVIDFLAGDTVLQAGGGGVGTTITNSPYIDAWMHRRGGASGGGGNSGGGQPGTGGRGGASLTIIAPTVILSGTSTINLSGAAGTAGGSGGLDDPGGGGGGSGDLTIITRSYTASGTITLNGGAGGAAWNSGSGAGATGGASGANGVRQIFIY